MARSDYFVEFPYYDTTLKQQERYKYLLKRYRDNKEDLSELKTYKIKGVTNLLITLSQLIVEINDFKKLLPKEPAAPAELKKARPKIVKKQPVKKARRVKKKIKKEPKKKRESIRSLKLGLAQIKDELEHM